MAVLAQEIAVAPATAGASALTFEVFSDLAAAEALWRRLEAEPAICGTPYQRFDWVRARVAGLAGAERTTPRGGVLRDGAGRPRMLLPLAASREAGCRVARFVGGRHANFHLPLALDPAGLDPDEVRAALRAAGRSLGIDLFAFALQPVTWDGVANPLAAGGTPSASDAYGMTFDVDPEATVKLIFSTDARKKLRAKERKLVEALGPVEHRRAAGAAEVDAILAAFYALKAARFSDQGIADPFADPAVKAFLRHACLDGLTEGRPAVELHALVAVRDERMVAIYAGAVDARRFSGMMTAFDGGPEIARCSPGDQLLIRLVRDQAARGRTAFDLGVGESDYKARTCEVTIPLAESWLPVTLRGRVLAEVQRAHALARRRAKRIPWVRTLARRLGMA